MKVLVLTPYLPHAGVGHGGGTAVRDLVRTLAGRHEVLTVALLRPGEADLVPEVEALGTRVAPLPFLDRTARGADRLRLAGRRLAAWARSRRSGYPLYVEKYHEADLSRRLQEIVAEFRPDAVQVEYLQLALLCRDLRRQRERTGDAGPRLVLNSHELGSLPRLRRAERAAGARERRRALAEARAWERLQIDASTWADVTLCVTPGDHERYAALGGRNLRTVPLGMDTDAVTADWAPMPPERHLFVGSFAHRPNRLAAEFLVRTVWPAVRAQRPAARLLLAGRGSAEFLAGLGAGAEGVTALGFVADLAPLFRECRLFLAPLPEGGGIKIKILEAMARGLPVVTTPVGAEGITGPADDAVLIADCDAGFADAVLTAAADEDACARRAERARRKIEREFGWSSLVERLTEIYAGG